MRVKIADLSVPVAESVAAQFTDVELGNRVVLRVEAIVNEESVDLLDVTGFGDIVPQYEPGESTLSVLPTKIERED